MKLNKYAKPGVSIKDKDYVIFDFKWHDLWEKAHRRTYLIVTEAWSGSLDVSFFFYLIDKWSGNERLS